MANTPVNGIGWYLDDKGTLISPWVGASGGTNANNPYSNVSGYWGTYLAPGSGGDTTGQYINSITQQPVGTVGRFYLGQRPDAYMGLARSPIIEQQLANIDTQSKVGYGGLLGRWQFGSTGNAPATAPVGWGRNPGASGGAAAAPWQPTQYKSNWYEPGSGNGQNTGGGGGGGGGGGDGGGGGGGGGLLAGGGNSGGVNQVVLPSGYGINAVSPGGNGAATTAYAGLLGNTNAPAGTQLLSKQDALATNRTPRDNAADQIAIDFTNRIMSAGRPPAGGYGGGTMTTGQGLWATRMAQMYGTPYPDMQTAWQQYKDQYTDGRFTPEQQADWAAYRARHLAEEAAAKGR